MWIAAKGFGSGANPNGPNPYIASDNNLLHHPGTAVLSSGRAASSRFRATASCAQLTATANRQIIPINYQAAATRNAAAAERPDQARLLHRAREPDLRPGARRRPARRRRPELTLFGKRITPNMHALVRRFPLLDHVYADSEASIDGHFWTSAAAVSDYTQKNWEQNYAARGRPYDFGVYSITWPGTGFLFDRAQQQRISYFNFGEAIAGTVPLTAHRQGQHRRADGAREPEVPAFGPRRDRARLLRPVLPERRLDRHRRDRRRATRQARDV